MAFSDQKKCAEGFDTIAEGTLNNTKTGELGLLGIFWPGVSRVRLSPAHCCCVVYVLGSDS